MTTRPEEATAALLALLKKPTTMLYQREGMAGLARLLGITKQTLSAATNGTDPLSYRIARRLTKLIALPMPERAKFLAAHVRAMHRPAIEVHDLDDHALELVIETIERYRERRDALASKRKVGRA